jgi:hypothetical protein
MASMFGWEGIVAHVFAYGAGMAAIYAAVWGAKWLRERIVDGRKARREANAQNWQMESRSTTSGLEFSSAETSKAPSMLEKKTPQVEVSAV